MHEEISGKKSGLGDKWKVRMNILSKKTKTEGGGKRKEEKRREKEKQKKEERQRKGRRTSISLINKQRSCKQSTDLHFER